MALKKALPDGNWALKYHYRTGIWLSKIITGREFGSQKSLPDENWALKYHYRTWVWLSISFKQTNFFTSKMVNNLQINVSPCSWHDINDPSQYRLMILMSQPLICFHCLSRQGRETLTTSHGLMVIIAFIVKLLGQGLLGDYFTFAITTRTAITQIFKQGMVLPVYNLV